MGEGTDRPEGERNRRQEAAQGSAPAARTPASDRPLTRRELRRREAEAAARRAALESAGGGPASEAADRAGSASAPDHAPAVAAGPARPTGTTPPAAGSELAAGAATSGPASRSASTGASARSARSAATGASAPSAESTARPTPAGGTRLPSRRSLRERAATASTRPETPQERTATGRRPVVRAPRTAQGVRSLDSTGRLTGVQPVVRPDAPRGAGGQDSGAAGAQGSGPGAGPALWDTHETFSVDLDPREVDATAGAGLPAVPETPPVRRRSAADTTATGTAAAADRHTADTGAPPAARTDAATDPSPSARRAVDGGTAGASSAARPGAAQAGRRPADSAVAGASPAARPPADAGTSPAEAADTTDAPRPTRPAGHRSPAEHTPLRDAARDFDRRAGEAEEEPVFPLRPQWIAISSVSGASPDSAEVPLPSRRSLRERMEEPAPADPERPNPAVTVVKVAVLVLVAVVIGALIWLLADQALDDGADDADLARPSLPITTTIDPEEPRAS